MARNGVLGMAGSERQAGLQGNFNRQENDVLRMPRQPM